MTPVHDLSTLNVGIDFTRLQTTPDSKALLSKDGALSLGWFDQPFYSIPLTPKKKTWFDPWRTKQWTYFSFFSQEFVLGLAVINTGYLSNAFVTVFDVKKRSFFEFEHLSVLGTAARVSANSIDGETGYHSKRIQIHITNRLEKNKSHAISFSCCDKKGNSLSGELTLYEEGAPLVNNREVAPNRVVYTHQNSTYRVQGTALWNGTALRFNPETDYATMDYTQGMHAYCTTWNWSSAAGLAKDGTPIAINLASDIGSGTNDVPAFWVRGKIFRADKAIFSYEHPQQRWFIKTKDGALNLQFQPIGQRLGSINFGFIASRFTQPIGYYSGVIKARINDDEQSYEIDHILGIAEEHFAKW